LALFECKLKDASKFYLPPWINSFSCIKCGITNIAYIPFSAGRADVSNNNLTMLPPLPKNLHGLNCDGNPLPFFTVEEWRKCDRAKAVILKWWKRKRHLLKSRRMRWVHNELEYKPGIGKFFEFENYVDVVSTK